MSWLAVPGGWVAVLVAVVAVAILVLLRKPTAPFSYIPFPDQLHKPILGCATELSDVICGTRALCVDHADEHGLCSFVLIGTTVVSVLKAEHVRKVLLASNYRKPIALINKHLAAFLGEKALVLLMGEEWSHHRRLMAKAFHWEHLRGMVPAMCSVGSSLVQRLTSEPGRINLFSTMKLATLDTIGATAFGYPFHTVKNGSHPVAAAFEYLLDESSRRQFEAPLSPECLCYSLPTAANKRFKQEIQVLRSTIGDIIQQRMNERNEAGTGEAEVHNDLLKYMLDANLEDEEAVSSQSLTDNLITLLFGGFDTTSIALTYTFYLVAKHSDVETKALEEIEAVCGTEDPTYESVSELKYCQAIIQEALRLYPPAPLTVRSLTADLDIEGRVIPEGTMMYIPIWWVHRSPLNWGSDAEAFRPERHLQEEARKTATSYKNVAFSGGQRNCVGQRFAMIEATVLFVMVIRHMHFTLASGNMDVVPVSTGVVQKPKGGELWVHAKEW